MGLTTLTDPLADLLPDAHVELKLRAASKAALMADLARRASGLTGIAADSLAAALAAREALGSTGVGAGIAVPHARIDGLDRIFGYFARLDRAVAFEAIDDRPVDLVFLLLSPTHANSEHLATLAAISRRLRDRSVTDAIRGADTIDAVRGLLMGGKS